MGRKNQCGFKKRERRNFLQKLNDLSTVFQQEDFNPDHRCYRDIVETELEDGKVYFSHISHETLTLKGRVHSKRLFL